MPCHALPVLCTGLLIIKQYVNYHWLCILWEEGLVSSIGHVAGPVWGGLRGEILYRLCYWIRLLGVVARLRTVLFAKSYRRLLEIGQVL